jgi:hypothetical protein
MNAILIVGIVVILIIVVVMVYYGHTATHTTYLVSVNGQAMYNGSDVPHVSSDDSERIVVAHGNTVDLFTSVGAKTGSLIINNVTNVAYNLAANTFMALDSMGNLYSIDEIGQMATVIGAGYSALYDTQSGYYSKMGSMEIVTGDLSDKTPVNGSYGTLEIITTVQH